jgi:uncharacterized membrane-anchored protein
MGAGKIPFLLGILMLVATVCGSSASTDPFQLQSTPPTSTASDQQARYTAALNSIGAETGPRMIALKDQAMLSLPEGYAYVPTSQARTFMTRLGNQTDEHFLGLVFPTAMDTWFAFLEYVPAGYIKDDDAKTWNADDLLKQISDNTEKENDARRAAHLPAFHVVGWIEKPHYDARAHRLVWSISIRNEGLVDPSNDVINYRTLVLGREGYVSLVMVTGAAAIDSEKPIANALLSDLTFVPGMRYENFDASTDRIAEYGLAALIGGIAIKKLGMIGLIAAFFLKFIKVIGIAVVAGLAAIRRFFTGKKTASTAAPAFETPAAAAAETIPPDPTPG